MSDSPQTNQIQASLPRRLAVYTRAELFRLRRRKGTRKMLIAFVIASAVSCIFMVALSGLMPWNTSAQVEFTPDEIQAMIVNLESSIANYDNIIEEASGDFTRTMEVRAARISRAHAARQIEVLQYVLDRGIDTGSATIILTDAPLLTAIFGGNLDAENMSAIRTIGRNSWFYTAFVAMAMSAMSVVMIIYAAIIGGTAAGVDYEDKSIRMYLLRPIKRGEGLFAKYFAALAQMVFYAVLGFLIAFVVTLLSQGWDMTTLVFHNGLGVVAVNPFVMLAGMFFSFLLMGIVYMTFAFMLASLTKSRIAAVILCIVITQVAGLFDIVALIAPPISWIMFFTHADINLYWANMMPLPNMNFLASLIINLLYIAGFLLLSWAVVRRRRLE